MSEPGNFDDAQDAAMAAAHDDARDVWQDLLPALVLRGIDPRLYELRLELTPAETVRRWQVAHTWAATDHEAAWAERNAENHLRRIRPATMADYDQRVARGADPLDAMRAVTPHLVNATVPADAVMSPADAAAYLAEHPELADRVAEEGRAILAAYVAEHPELADRVAEEGGAILERRQAPGGAGGAPVPRATRGIAVTDPTTRRPLSHIQQDLELALAYQKRYQGRPSTHPLVTAMRRDNERQVARLRAELRARRSIGVLAPVALPDGLNGAETVGWLSSNQRALGRDGQQWLSASAGGALAVRVDPVLATQLERLPGEYLVGMLATAAYGCSAETATAEFYAEWLTGHRRQITAVADALSDPSARQPYPYAPLDTVQAKELLERALIVPVENDLHSTGVDIVRTLDIDIRSYRCQHAYDGQLHMGWAAWEGDRVDDWDEPADLRGGLGLVLVAPGVVEAITLDVIPDPFGADDLVIDHAVTSLVAGGVSRLSGQFPYDSAWGRQPGWRWDPGEAGHNLEELRLAVLRGSRQWWLTGRVAQDLEGYVDDLHAAAGATSPLLAARWDGLHETVTPTEAADRLWRPLLERSIEELAALGPSTVQATCHVPHRGYDSECPSCVARQEAPVRPAGPRGADQRVGGWVLEAGELNVRGERHIGEGDGRAARLDLLRSRPPTVELGPGIGPEWGPTL